MKVQISHILIVFSTAFLAGVLGYLEAPHAPEALKIALLHAAGAGLASVVAVMKRSPIDTPRTPQEASDLASVRTVWTARLSTRPPPRG